MSAQYYSWETDAENIEPGIGEKMLYRNKSVSEFLDYDNKHFIVASKGIGKTLLLKCKRYNLENKYHETDVFFLPTARPYLGFSSDFSFLSKQFKSFLEDWKNAKLLWKISIQLSVINYFRNKTKKIISEKIENYPEWLKEIINNPEELNPSDVFDTLTRNKNISEFYKQILDWKTNINKLFEKDVTSGICIFLDRLDQALLHDTKKLWISMQAGLIEAAWDLMRSNNHVKIYCSIRQEAYYNYESSNKLAISGEITILRYNHEDLENLIEKLSTYYEKKSFGDIIGFNEFTHPKTGIEEDVKDYIIRHSIGRPRDLVSIASSLRGNQNGLDVDSFREIVNKKSSQDIARNLFEESKLFLECLSEKKERERFLSLIPRNIIDKSILLDICRKYNNEVSCDGNNCKSCTKHYHPFCDIYNIGLLGYVDKDDVKENLRNKQYFKEPYDISEVSIGTLPVNADFFLIHPILNNYIKELRSNRFIITQLISVGNGYDWLESHSHAFELSKLIDNLSNDQLSKELIDFIKSVPYNNHKENSKNKLSEIIDNFNKYGNLVVNSDKITQLVYRIIDLISSHS